MKNDLGDRYATKAWIVFEVDPITKGKGPILSVFSNKKKVWNYIATVQGASIGCDSLDPETLELKHIIGSYSGLCKHIVDFDCIYLLSKTRGQVILDSYIVQ